MFEVAPWKSTTKLTAGAGWGGMCTISSRGSPLTVMWCTAVPGAKPAPSAQRAATAVVVDAVPSVVALARVEVGPLAAGELELHAAGAASAIARAAAAATRRTAVNAAR